MGIENTGIQNTAMAAGPDDAPDIAEVERLARETDSPIELVKTLYSIESAKLEKTARIKTYVPVLVHRHVKSLLLERRAAS